MTMTIAFTPGDKVRVKYTDACKQVHAWEGEVRMLNPDGSYQVLLHGLYIKFDAADMEHMPDDTNQA